MYSSQWFISLSNSFAPQARGTSLPRLGQIFALLLILTLLPIPAAALQVGTTSSTISASGAAGKYTLTGTVNATAVPTGSVYFHDTSNRDQLLGTAPLGSPTMLNLGILSGPSMHAGGESTDIAVGDFNGDGYPDFAVGTGFADSWPICKIWVYLSDGRV